jgi:flavin reductase (DIM6/NTAB) family NADH-FMN oxidoreductase RutF
MMAGVSGLPHQEVEEARFRQVLGHFATGVTVVTAVDAGEPVGLSVNSFTSVSLDPPLVAFCAALGSSSWARMREVGTFCVNILATDQEDVCRVFASKVHDKFRGLAWRPSPLGGAVLGGVLAWIDCDVESEQVAGDHVLVIGRVRDLDVVREGGPLVFYRGGYGRFEP